MDCNGCEFQDWRIQGVTFGLCQFTQSNTSNGTCQSVTSLDPDSGEVISTCVDNPPCSVEGNLKLLNSGGGCVRLGTGVCRSGSEVNFDIHAKAGGCTGWWTTALDAIGGGAIMWNHYYTCEDCENNATPFAYGRLEIKCGSCVPDPE